MSRAEVDEVIALMGPLAQRIKNLRMQQEGFTQEQKDEIERTVAEIMAIKKQEQEA